jgi:hypothetical protein
LSTIRESLEKYVSEGSNLTLFFWRSFRYIRFYPFQLRYVTFSIILSLRCPGLRWNKLLSRSVRWITILNFLLGTRMDDGRLEYAKSLK